MRPPHPPAAQGPPQAGRRGPGAPRAVITAAVAAARRVSASAPPPRLIGAASRGRGRRTTRSRKEQRIDRPRGRQLVEAAAGGEGAGARGAVTGMEGARTAYRSVVHRELSQPPPLLSPQNAPHIALGPHLRPPFLGVPSALCQTPGEEWVGCASSLCPKGLVSERAARPSSVWARPGLPVTDSCPRVRLEYPPRPR